MTNKLKQQMAFQVPVVIAEQLSDGSYAHNVRIDVCKTARVTIGAYDAAHAHTISDAIRAGSAWVEVSDDRVPPAEATPEQTAQLVAVIRSLLAAPTGRLGKAESYKRASLHAHAAEVLAKVQA